MQVFIYCADIYCRECGEAIRERLEAISADINADTPETEYDSDEYPKGPYCNGGGESDSPQHCGSHADCINAIEMADGTKIGAWLENDLTTDGVAYVREAIERGGDVAELWAQWYALELEFA